MDSISSSRAPPNTHLRREWDEKVAGREEVHDELKVSNKNKSRMDLFLHKAIWGHRLICDLSCHPTNRPYLHGLHEPDNSCHQRTGGGRARISMQRKEVGCEV